MHDAWNCLGGAYSPGAAAPQRTPAQRPSPRRRCCPPCPAGAPPVQLRCGPRSGHQGSYRAGAAALWPAWHCPVLYCTVPMLVLTLMRKWPGKLPCNPPGPMQAPTLMRCGSLAGGGPPGGSALFVTAAAAARWNSARSCADGTAASNKTCCNSWALAFRPAAGWWSPSCRQGGRRAPTQVVGCVMAEAEPPPGGCLPARRVHHRQ